MVKKNNEKIKKEILRMLKLYYDEYVSMNNILQSVNMDFNDLTNMCKQDKKFARLINAEAKKRGELPFCDFI